MNELIMGCLLNVTLAGLPIKEDQKINECGLIVIGVDEKKKNKEN